MLALITGASQGIGLMYARELASRGYDIFMVSNQERQLADESARIEKDFGVKTHVRCMDLAAENAADELFEYSKQQGFEVEVLINNAGVFFFNPLSRTPEARINLMIHLHVRTVTQMCRLFGDDMSKRGHGHILNMSSMSAWMAMPGIQIYNATKAYILNFSRSLWYELRPLGVSVTAVCPGAVDTGLYGLSTYWRRVAVAIGVSMPPEKLVKKALKAMFRGKKQAIPGAINRPFIFVIKHLPDWVVFFAIKKLAQFQK